MPEIDILEARVFGDEVAVHGAVDGAGYRVTVPKADVDAAGTALEKQRVVARAPRTEWKRERATALNLKGRITLGDAD